MNDGSEGIDQSEVFPIRGELEVRMQRLRWICSILVRGEDDEGLPRLQEEWGEDPFVQLILVVGQ